MFNEDHKEEVVHTTEGTPRWLGVAVVALAAVSLLALGAVAAAFCFLRLRDAIALPLT